MKRKIDKTYLYLMEITGLQPEQFVRDDRIPPMRWDKICRLTRPESRAQSLGAWLLLIKALEELCPDVAIPPTVERDSAGKPYFKEMTDGHFNLSHTSGMVACAISPYPVGVDLEKVKTVKQKMADRFFHPQESLWVKNRTSQGYDRAFCEMWVLKESFVKALGTGLRLPMADYHIRMEEPIRVEYGEEGKLYRFRQIPFEDPDYVGAVCVKGEPELEIRVRNLSDFGINDLDR